MALAACSVQPPSAPAPAPTTTPAPARPSTPLLLKGSFSDGTPLELDALKGRPWVVNLWLPG
ncbi:MAG: hypothetical protein JST54_07260 [Deltaproteobacteria bacterium]|nr:hypothetical protein [Deltaproteobacteria bacterium]